MNATPERFESIGRYKIIRVLGRGGMSIVYLAQDTELERDVAIKCVDTSSAATARLAQGLRDEAKLLAQLNHPNIVQLYDVVEQDSTLGLVIEYIGGETLTHRLPQRPSRELRLKWLAEIAEGIASAHKHGIAHCDIKSENILITVDNVAKVADFGIAKLKLDDYLEDDGLTRMDSVSGSYFSLSPEQATGQAVDTRTDIFSLAVLIHQTLLSSHPFGETNNKTALIQRVIDDPFELSESALTVLGVRIAELLKNCLSKLPEERLYSACEIADLLRSEALIAVDNTQNDYTVAIATQQPTSNSVKGLTKFTKGTLPKVAFIGAGVLFGFILFKWLSPSEEVIQDINYIAVDAIEVTATDDFNKALLPLIKSTLQQSTESTVLSFKQTGLVDAKELNAIEGSFGEKAKAAGVDDVMVLSANCFERKCDIKIQRRSGERMAVSKQTTFPIASNSLIDLKNAVSIQLPKLFNLSDLSLSDNDIAISEANYRKYLVIYENSSSGVSLDPKDLNEIQNLISESPSFIPSYSLLNRVGGYIYRNTRDEKVLTTVLSVINNAPLSIQEDKALKLAKISILLDLGKIEESKLIFSTLKPEDDALFFSVIESAIAFAEEDYKKLLLLDRQNAVWRPSVNNLYNLATSEFFVGNHEQAKELVDKALSLSPDDSYALGLKATIEMSLGNLPLALKSYEAILKKSKDSTVYSNYGLALILSKKYEEAILANKKAIQINPNASLHHLNLADSYTLSGQLESARLSYDQVVILLSTPKTAQEFSSLAQAYSHLGKFKTAVKTLKTANKKFPNVSELDYAASIVNTLAENYIAAVVDVNDAINGGTAPVWFSLEWFKPLCKYEDFTNITGAATNHLCK